MRIKNFHLARVTNGPTEALGNLIKWIKRIGFGFRNFENYRAGATLTSSLQAMRRPTGASVCQR
jgi:transposase